GRRDQFAGAALGLDLLLGRLRKVVRFHGQFLAQVPVAEDAHAVRRAFGQAGRLERLGVHRRAGVEAVEVADVDDVVILVPRRVTEAALGDAAEQGHLPAFEHRRRHLGAGAGPLALGAARGGLAHAGADAAADALLPRPLVDAN